MLGWNDIMRRSLSFAVVTSSHGACCPVSAGQLSQRHAVPPPLLGRLEAWGGEGEWEAYCLAEGTVQSAQSCGAAPLRRRAVLTAAAGAVTRG